MREYITKGVLCLAGKSSVPKEAINSLPASNIYENLAEQRSVINALFPCRRPSNEQGSVSNEGELERLMELITRNKFYNVTTQSTVDVSMMHKILEVVIKDGTKAVGGTADTRPFLERLNVEIIQKLDTCDAETKENLSKCVDNLGNSPFLVAKSETATLSDVRLKRDAKNAKGYKIPFECFKENVRQTIKYACGLTADKPSEEGEGEVSGEEERSESDEMSAAAQRIVDLFSVQENNTVPSVEDTRASGRLPDVLDELSPASKVRYSLLSPGRKEEFKKGVMAGLKIATGGDGDEHDDDSHSSNEEESQASSRRRLFTPEGSIELLSPCVMQEESSDEESSDEESSDEESSNDNDIREDDQSPKAKKRKDENREAYKFCICKENLTNINVSNLQNSEEEEDNMLICENRNTKHNKCNGNRYFHLSCLGLTQVPAENPCCKIMPST
ncbi:hypothetical protein AC249_AIPGENE26545 [Exaiptasia diaphana]|nr:hypothetical protein AC249_AIPGENE26545 [Exaiptasia diaphana]